MNSRLCVWKVTLVQIRHVIIKDDFYKDYVSKQNTVYTSL